MKEKTILAHLQSMDLDQFADFLDNFTQTDNTPWILWFNRKYCAFCNPEIKDGEAWAYCELNSECRFLPGFDISDPVELIKKWLQQPVSKLEEEKLLYL